MRLIVSWALALALVVVFAGGGCASGGSDQSGGGDDGSLGDVTTGDVEAGDAKGDGNTCTGGKVLCAATCVNTGTDPKNCGKCGTQCMTGEVCSLGKCTAGCAPGLTLCGGADASAPVVDSGTGDDSSTGDSGAPSPSDAGASGAYCTNTGTDPDNCGGCGMSCGPNHMCTNGMCSALVCGTGMQGCPATGTCIPTGTCCQSGDCMIAGEVCPMAGGMCSCPSGERECTANTSCISNTACCTVADCNKMGVTGQTCPVAGQPCKCDPSKQCCVPSDCPSEPHVTGAACTNNTCNVSMCSSGCYDFDKMYTNGCECCDSTYGHTCANATSGGMLTVGGTPATFTGQIPEAAGGDWFAVTFSGENDTAFHAAVTFTTNTNTAYVFDIVKGTCSGAGLTCGTEGGTSTGDTTWETSYSGPNPAGDPNSKNPAGASNFIAIPALGTLFIHVHRKDMTTAPTSCDSYTLKISE